MSTTHPGIRRRRLARVIAIGLAASLAAVALPAEESRQITAESVMRRVRRREDGPWDVSSTLRSTLVAPHAVDFEFRFKLARWPRPAWDFQYVVRRVDPAGHGFRGRLVWKKWVSRQDCVEEYERWRAGLDEPGRE